MKARLALAGILAASAAAIPAPAHAVDAGCSVSFGSGDNQGSCTYLALDLANGNLSVSAPNGFAAAQVVCTVGASNLLLTTQTEGETSFLRFGLCTLTLVSPFAASAGAN